VPLSAKSLVLYVNTALAGGAPLESVEGFEALRAGTPAGSFPLAWELDSTYASAAMFHAYGARHIDDEGRFALEGVEAAAALERMRSLVDAEVVPSESSGDLVRNLFRSGHAVAAVSGPWLAPDLPAQLQYEVRPLPRVETADGRSATLVPFSTIEAVFLASHDSEAGSGSVEARHEAARARACARSGVGRSWPRAARGTIHASKRGRT
jgi:maltose-binding protein MalE